MINATLKHKVVKLVDLVFDKLAEFSFHSPTSHALSASRSFSFYKEQSSVNEPRHDKTNKMSVRSAKTQISLGICPVWSESSLCAHW